jgi:hypothetical protein
LSTAEIQALPTSGAAWESVHDAAYGSWETPNLQDQTKGHGAEVLAGALVYARTGDASLRAKTRDAIMAAKRTMDEPSEWDCCDSSVPERNTRTLGVGRQVYAYVFAADIIDLESYDATSNTEFSNWLRAIRTTPLPQSGRPNNSIYTLTYAHETWVSNWSGWEGASRMAASIYVGDMADLARADSLFHACTDRSYYPEDAPGYDRYGYFQPTGAWNAAFSCLDENTWVAINPAGCDPILDGAFVEDVSRSGYSWPPGSIGMMYSWEMMQGQFIQAEMLHRQGYDAYNYGDRGLKRAMDFMVRAGYQMAYASQRWVPWLANYRYGTDYQTPLPLGLSYGMSWTDWTHATASTVQDTTPPAPITDLTAGL